MISKTPPSIKLRFPLALVLAVFSLVPPVLGAEITPFYTFNQSPLVQIFGLPAPENARIVPQGKVEGMVVADLASNFAVDEEPGEQITLDGEIYRTTLVLRYGLGKNVEAGLDIPYITESGGFMDSAVEGWHKFFGISEGGRDQVSRNRLLFRYVRNGVERLHIEHANGGIGDIRLTGAVQLLRDDDAPGRGVALRGSLKVPTGNSDWLHGSGSTDFALWLSAADEIRFRHGHWGFYGAAGGMAATKGDVLKEMRRNLIAFGTLGTGWSSWDWLALKAQLSVHTPFYRGSSLKELGVTSVQAVLGGTFAFSPRTSLDVAFSEDLLVLTSSPDVAFNIALRTRF